MWDHLLTMRPLFADPKIDLVFKKLFGSEEHKSLLIALLHTLLELDDAHKLEEVSFLSRRQKPLVEGHKWSIVDVKCCDIQGTSYVVKIQVLYMEIFEQRVVYDVRTAYTQQLRSGERFPQQDDVIAVSICGFKLWPVYPDTAEAISMLSRWQMQEQHFGVRGLPHIQHVFLELTKYTCGDKPVTLLEKWAYFFTSASDFRLVPDVLVGTPMEQALLLIKSATFPPEEWEAYDRAKVVEHDARGALSLARKEGFREGRAKARPETEANRMRQVIEIICQSLGLHLSEDQQHALPSMDIHQLKELLASLFQTRP
jgi:predicted transposase/invertase (TIGR01784 family)